MIAITACALLALGVYPYESSAQPAPPPAAAPAPARRWVMPPPPAESEANVRPSGVDLAGDLGLEIVGSLLGGLIAAGVLFGGAVMALDDQRCETGCGALLVTGMVGVFVAPALGVTIAGEATGGQGSFGMALLGTVPGLLLSLPGMVAGAVIGYRLSAPDTPNPNHGAMPQARGAMLLDLRF